MKDRAWLVVLAVGSVVTGLAVIALLLLWQWQGKESSQQQAAASAVELRAVVCDMGVMELEQFRDEAAQRTNQFITDADRPWTQSARGIWPSKPPSANPSPSTGTRFKRRHGHRGLTARARHQPIGSAPGRECSSTARSSGAINSGETSSDWPTDAVPH